MKRESFLLRLDPRLLEALRRWADDELRSVNGQIEYVLRRALADAGRRLSERPGDPVPPRNDDAGPAAAKDPSPGGQNP